MKYLKSTNTKSLDEMELGKMRLHVGGKDYENIWVKRDYQADKSYLQNSAIGLYPFPSWGVEIPTSHTVYDLTPLLPENADDVVLITHSEMYDQLVKDELIDGAGTFNWERMKEMQEEAKQAKEIPKEVQIPVELEEKAQEIAKEIDDE